MSAYFLQQGQRHLLAAANAWRRGRALHELPEDSPEAPVGAELAARPMADGQIAIAVQPQRTGRHDADIELKTIALLETDAFAFLSRYERLFGRIYNADSMSEVLDVHGSGERWTQHDAVRSSASAAVQAAFDRALAQEVTTEGDVLRTMR